MTPEVFLILNGESGLTPLPKPTRDQICYVRTSGMQGMWVTVSQSADHSVKKSIPFTDGLLTSEWLDETDRANVYAEKRRLGDTHVILNLTWRYDEPGLAYEMPGRDLSKDLPRFRDYIEEALAEGFYPLVMLGGDGPSKPKNPDGSYPYNDPVGWTYGREWLIENFAAIYEYLRDLSPWILWSAGYDGCIPAWGDRGQVDEWTLHARKVIGLEGYLLQHFSAGYCWWGGTEGNNFLTPGGKAIDVVTTCMPVPMNPPDVKPPSNFLELPDDQRAPWDQVWQIEARLIPNDKYHRPPDQPAGDDDHKPPYYLATGTPRGPFHHCVLEIDTYGHVRGWHDLAYTNRRRAYLLQMGCESVG